MPIHTVAVLATHYRGKRAALDVLRTHALAHDGEKTLCGRIAADATVESMPESILPPTCPTCAKRDPRTKSGGPFILAAMLQLR